MADEKVTFAEYAVKSGERPEFVNAFMVKFKISPDFRSTPEKFAAAMKQWKNTPVDQSFLQ